LKGKGSSPRLLGLCYRANFFFLAIFSQFRENYKLKSWKWSDFLRGLFQSTLVPFVLLLRPYSHEPCAILACHHQYGWPSMHDTPPPVLTPDHCCGGIQFAGLNPGGFRSRFLWLKFESELTSFWFVGTITRIKLWSFFFFFFRGLNLQLWKKHFWT
jgi:hypothetical protein